MVKKNRKIYLSVFFLFCFIASFSINTAQNLNSKVYKTCSLTDHQTSFSHSDEASKTSNDFLFEENENETENDFELLAFVLPFFISDYQFSVVHSNFFSANSIAEKLTKPIYIQVCNFRI